MMGGIDPVVDWGWMDERRDDVVVVDVRWYLDGRSGIDAYRAGHIPGAVFVDLDRWLAASDLGPQRGRHPLPSPDTFAQGMEAAGISDDSVVVAYDDAAGTFAARLVWMLRVTGHRAALLDGGLEAYKGRLEQGERTVAAGTFSTVDWPSEQLASADDALDPSNVVIDARDPQRYRGEVEPVDPVAGHIPGAVNVPCRGNVDVAGRFLAPEALRRRFAGAGVGSGTVVVSYCGSGVTACHNLLALEHAGLGPGRLYVGSWSAYSNSGLPVATGGHTVA